MIIYVHGPDTFRSREKLRLLIDEFKKKRDPHGHAVTRFIAPDVDFARITHTVQSGGLFTAKRLAVLEGVVGMGTRDLRESLLAFLPSFEREGHASDSIIIFWEEDIEALTAHASGTARNTHPSRARTKRARGSPDSSARDLHAFLAQQHYVFHYPVLTSSARISWIKARFQEYGGQGDHTFNNALVTALMGELCHVDTELRKLAAYGHGRTLTREDIDRVVERAGEPPALFPFLDGLMALQIPPTLALLPTILQSGIEPVILVSHFGRVFRTIALVKSCLEQSQQSGATSATTLHLHPFVVQKTGAFARRYSWQVLRAIQQLLLTLDYSVKNKTGDDPSLPFESFLYALIPFTPLPQISYSSAA